MYDCCTGLCSVTGEWPLERMQFMKCPAVREYLSSGRNRKEETQIVHTRINSFHHILRLGHSKLGFLHFVTS